MNVLDPKTGQTITICDPGQVIDMREHFAMKRLADEEKRKVERLRETVRRTYPRQSDSGDESRHDTGR
jgi:hypothetical protein